MPVAKRHQAAQSYALTLCLILLVVPIELCGQSPTNSSEMASNEQPATSQSLQLTPVNQQGSLKPGSDGKSITDWQPFLGDQNKTIEQLEFNKEEGSEQDESSVSPASHETLEEGLPAPKIEEIPELPQQNSPPEVIEPKVDLRVPEATEESEDDDDDVEFYWIHPFVDDHSLLWRENREGLEILFNDASGLGITTLGFDTEIKPGDTPWWAHLKFGWNFLDGPRAPDIRSQTYDLSLEINSVMPLNENVSIHLQLAPTWATDWDNKTDDAFRLIGGGLVAIQIDEGVTGIIGTMALDRPDMPVVPAAGLRLFDDEFAIDIAIPRPRIAWKCSGDEQEESWFYIAGEIGGGSWAVERELNRKDIMGYRDHRLLIGWETKKIDGSRSICEFGWVFDRELEFHRYGGDQTLGETFLLRFGQTY